MHAVAPTENRTFIKVGGRPVATLSADPIRVNTLQASSSVGMPSVELLGGIAATDPTGVVVVEHGDEGLAFALEHGRVIGAFGSGPRGSMQGWTQAARTQELERAKGTAERPGVGMARLFIERCVLDHLVLAHEVGSVLSVLRGDVKWTGTTMAFDRAPRLQHLLMELAREADDCALIERRLQPLSRVAVPVSPPLMSADDLPAEPEEGSFADLDDADASEHQVRWSVWSLCGARRSIEEIADRCVFGRAPTLRALDQLRRRGCIAFEEPAAATPVVPQIELGRVVPTPPVAAVFEPASSVEPVELAPPRKRRGWLAVGLASVAVSAGLWFALRPAPAQPQSAGAAEAQVERRVVAPAPATAAVAAAPASVEVAGSLPEGIEALRELSFEERHRLLAGASGDVAVEHHVGLDLLQAEQSATPCRTFADALSTVEAAADVEPYGWALREVQAPTGTQEACAGLSERLSALRPEEASSDPPARRRGRRVRRSSRGPRAVAPAQSEPESATPEPVVEAEPEPTPEPAAAPEPSAPIASKLDDGGLRSLD